MDEERRKKKKRKPPLLLQMLTCGKQTNTRVRAPSELCGLHVILCVCICEIVLGLLTWCKSCIKLGLKVCAWLCSQLLCLVIMQAYLIGKGRGLCRKRKGEKSCSSQVFFPPSHIFRGHVFSIFAGVSQSRFLSLVPKLVRENTEAWCMTFPK